MRIDIVGFLSEEGRLMLDLTIRFLFPMITHLSLGEWRVFGGIHVCMYCVCIFVPFKFYWDCSLAVSFCSGSLNASYVGSYHIIGALGSS